MIAVLALQVAWLVSGLWFMQWVAGHYHSDPGIDSLGAIALLITGEVILAMPGVALILGMGRASGNSPRPSA